MVTDQLWEIFEVSKQNNMFAPVETVKFGDIWSGNVHILLSACTSKLYTSVEWVFVYIKFWLNIPFYTASNECLINTSVPKLADWPLALYVLATSMVMSCTDLWQCASWQLYSAIPLGDQAAGTMTQSHYPDTKLTGLCPILIIMLSVRLGRHKYQFYKSLVWLSRIFELLTFPVCTFTNLMKLFFLAVSTLRSQIRLGSFNINSHANYSWLYDTTNAHIIG